MKKFNKIVCLIGMIMCLSGTIVQAQDGYCTDVIVEQASGVTTGNAIKVKSTRSDCGDFKPGVSLWFRLDEERQDAMLAAALTAIALDAPITIVTKEVNVYKNWGTIVHVGVGR